MPVVQEPKQVFISFSTKDQERAEEIYDYFETNGLKCWMSSRDIKAGNFALEIVKAIRDCDVFFLVWTENVQQSAHVFNELTQACNANKLILPMKLDKSSYPEEYDYLLASKHFYDGSENYVGVLNQICLQITEIVGNRDSVNIVKKESPKTFKREKTVEKPKQGNTFQHKCPTCKATSDEVIDDIGVISGPVMKDPIVQRMRFSAIVILSLCMSAITVLSTIMCSEAGQVKWVLAACAVIILVIYIAVTYIMRSLITMFVDPIVHRNQGGIRVFYCGKCRNVHLHFNLKSINVCKKILDSNSILFPGIYEGNTYVLESCYRDKK